MRDCSSVHVREGHFDYDKHFDSACAVHRWSLDLALAWKGEWGTACRRVETIPAALHESLLERVALGVRSS